MRLDLRFALRLATGLMLVFTVYLWYLSTLAHPPACGCLGLTGIFKSSRQEAAFGVARNFLILCAIKLAYDYYFPRAEPLSNSAPLTASRTKT